MLRRYAFGGLTPPAAAALFGTPTDCEVPVRMAIAGAEMALGARLMEGWTVDAEWGYRPLRNEKPRMGVRGSLGGVDGWDDWPTP